jgi:hypothetical protein
MTWLRKATWLGGLCAAAGTMSLVQAQTATDDSGYRSTHTWAAASNGLPNVPIQKLLAAPNDLSGNTVYAATWLGVYRTTNGGLSWSQFGAGLPTVEVSDLYMPADGSFLRASTYGRGMWDLPLH